MKKVILALTTVALAGASVQTAAAGGCGWGSCGNSGWNTAAAVVGGVTAGLVIGQALAPRPAYYVAPAPAYYPTPGYGYSYYYAAPVRPAVVYAAPAPVVYVAPAPVVVYSPPVYSAPPAVSFSFGYYSGGRPHCYRGGWR